MLSLFYLFASVLIISAIMVIQVKNPVHSVLFLILVFFNSSCLLILLEAEFLAMIFIVIYVGAIAVLFLFVVMMLNIKIYNREPSDILNYLPLGGIIGIIFLLEIFLIIDSDFIPLLKREEVYIHINWISTFESLTNIQNFGQLLYTHYFYFLLISGIILLVAIIGTIVLTLQRDKVVKRQQIFQQISRDFRNAIFVVNHSNKKITS